MYPANLIAALVQRIILIMESFAINRIHFTVQDYYLILYLPVLYQIQYILK